MEEMTRDQACEELEKAISDLPVHELHSKEEFEDWEWEANRWEQ